MKKVVLHIGMHKTGSSSVQKTLNGFDDGRVRYAQLGGENHSIAIYSIFSEARYQKRFFVQRGIDRDEIDRKVAVYRKRLIAELNQDREVLIISGEDISRIPAADVPAMKTFFEAHCDEVQIVGYVRDPVGFASSQFQQLVKFDTRTIALPEPEYRVRFQKFLDVFGKETVTLREFNRDKLVDGSVVQDIMEICGIREAEWPEKVTNESLSDAATRLLFHFNRFGPVTTGCPQAMEARKEFVTLLGKAFPGPSYRFPKEVFGKDSVDLEDLTWLKTETGIDFSDTIAPGKTNIDLALQDMDRPATEDLERLRKILTVRGIRTRPDVTLRDALTFLFYDVLAQGWKSRTAERQARKRARRRALAAASRESTAAQ